MSQVSHSCKIGPRRCPKQCLFCPNPADSAEDVWSTWILEDLKPVQPIQIKRGKDLAKWVDNPEVRIKCVCQRCNNGWMNEIEGENKPHKLAIMNDKQTVLTPMQQKSLTRWAILKAMVLDGASKTKRTPFYSEGERVGMKPPLRSFPVGTHTWIGRLPAKAFHAGLMDRHYTRLFRKLLPQPPSRWSRTSSSKPRHRHLGSRSKRQQSSPYRLPSAAETASFRSQT